MLGSLAPGSYHAIAPAIQGAISQTHYDIHPHAGVSCSPQQSHLHWNLIGVLLPVLIAILISVLIAILIAQHFSYHFCLHVFTFLKAIAIVIEGAIALAIR